MEKSEENYLIVSSLIVSPRSRLILENKLKYHTNLRRYFTFLLEKYSKLVLTNAVPGYNNYTTKYQENDPEHLKINFRPVPEDWYEFKMYANYLGISMSALFAYLLIFDSVEWWRYMVKSDAGFDGVPTRPFLTRLTITFIRAENIKKKLEHERFP